jgi:alkanesulfonate monooxygenase SsuD/methylene tetrahydromethanopterin reductase-like flavin-dependent oxidoreductase (luciferase family)
MDYGVHLPLIAFDDQHWSLDRLLTYVRTAEQLGFQMLAANDHLVFSRPWLDGPTALAAVLAQTGRMTLATTVALPAVRIPSSIMLLGLQWFPQLKMLLREPCRTRHI